MSLSSMYSEKKRRDGPREGCVQVDQSRWKSIIAAAAMKVTKPQREDMKRSMYLIFLRTTLTSKSLEHL